MNRIFRISKSFIIFVILLPLMTVISVLIYNEYLKTKENIFEIIQTHLISEKLTLLKNYSDYLGEELGADIQTAIIADEYMYIHYEKELSFLQGDEIKYLYLLHKDKEDKFRYLLDATKEIEERAEYNQRFDPQTDIWDKAYSTKQLQTIQQLNLQSLWITIAYPIIVDGEVVAILGADFTYDVYNRIVDTLKPMEKIYLYVSVFMSIMLIVAYILIYLYYINRKKSFIDPLTKCYNRQYLTEFLETTSLQDYQLMMIDLDYFKLVNDNYGHDAGDEVLISVVTEIRSQIRQVDILIRFGGEEFILLVYKHDLKNCVKMAHRIRVAVMNRTITIQNNQINSTISIGINPLPYFAKNIEEAIKIADEQLYKAKAGGRNRVEIYHSGDKQLTNTSKRISDVQSAIDEDRIKCAFQPIYDSKNHRIYKYEMLLRLTDSNGDIIAPNEFLPSIRHTQIYINLTRIVLDTALQTLKEQSSDLTLNLDIQDILNDDILDLLKERFKDNKQLASRICIEILEHEEITNFELIKERTSFLKELGLKLALDDFGSGYANFRYLLHFNIDILKIDGSLVRDIDKDEHAYNIVSSIVELAKKMNIKTVAEQIETKEELDTVTEIGVDFLQGYYLAKPSFDMQEV